MTLLCLILSLLTQHLQSNEKDIYLKTSDGCEINATINISSSTKIAFLEVHGLGSNKEEWRLFNNYLSSKGIGYLSIDLRGHGGSTKCKGKKIKYPNLSKTDIEGFTKEISHTYNYLKQSYPHLYIIPIGASIGANAVMKEFYKKPIKIVLLSPGIRYATYDISDLFKKTKAKILLVTSETDTYSFTSTKLFLQILISTRARYSLVLAKSGHGVEIFNSPNGKEYMEKILEWALN